MPTIESDFILGELESIFSDYYPDNPEVVDDSLSYGSQILFGTDEVPGVIAGDGVHAEDYVYYQDAICHDEGVGDFYYGSDSTDPLFFEVRDELDGILQNELWDGYSGSVRFWGDCSEVSFGADSGWGSGLDSGSSSKSKREWDWRRDLKDDPFRDIEADRNKLKNLEFFTMSSFPEPKPKKEREPIDKPKYPTTRWEREEFCKSLGIPKGGAYTLYVGFGFYCEFNYSPQDIRKSIFVGMDEKDEPMRIPMNMKSPESPQIKTPTSPSSPMPTPTPLHKIMIAHPRPIPLLNQSVLNDEVLVGPYVPVEQRNPREEKVSLSDLAQLSKNGGDVQKYLEEHFGPTEIDESDYCEQE